MIPIRYKLWFLTVFLGVSISWSQTTTIDILSYEEYLGYVKQHHPLLKQTAVRISQSEANLMKTRGALDPTLSFSYDDKTFKSANYWNKFNTTFKVPTIFGVDFKANYEKNYGDYLNPELTVPENGLYSAGVSIDLARGFLMNERLANVRIKENNIQQSKAMQDLVINKILHGF